MTPIIESFSRNDLFNRGIMDFDPVLLLLIVLNYGKNAEGSLTIKGRRIVLNGGIMEKHAGRSTKECKKSAREN